MGERCKMPAPLPCTLTPALPPSVTSQYCTGQHSPQWGAPLPIPTPAPSEQTPLNLQARLCLKLTPLKSPSQAPPQDNPL